MARAEDAVPGGGQVAAEIAPPAGRQADVALAQAAVTSILALQIGPLRDRKRDLHEARPWQAGQSGTLQWNKWANEVVALRVQLLDGPSVNDSLLHQLSEVADWTFTDEFASTANFGRFIFPGKVTFAAVQFAQGANFNEATFHGEASFAVRNEETDATGGAEFLRSAQFNKATFLRLANFSHTTFHPTAAFEGCKFVQGANFIEAQFRQAAIFTGAKFGSSEQSGGHTWFDRAAFAVAGTGNRTDFSNARFHHGVSFEQAEFQGAKSKQAPVLFDGTRFERAANFRGASLGSLSQDKSIKTCALSFTDTYFKIAPDFSGTVHFDALDLPPAFLRNGATFANIVFEHPVRIAHATSQGYDQAPRENEFPLLSFRGCTFKTPIDWAGARLPVMLDFQGAVFEGALDLSTSILGPSEPSQSPAHSDKGHNFDNASFRDDVKLSGAMITANLSCSASSFAKRVFLEGIQFRNHAKFTASSFAGSLIMGRACKLASAALFDQATFGDLFEVRDATFDGPISFVGSTFARPVTIENCQFSESVAFDDCEFSRAVRFTGSKFGVHSAKEAGKKDAVPPASPARVSFERSTFEQMAYFDGVRFLAEPDFSGANSKSSFSFNGCRFIQTLPRFLGTSLGNDPHITADNIEGEPIHISHSGTPLDAAALKKELANRYSLLSIKARSHGDHTSEREFSRRAVELTPRGLGERMLAGLFSALSDSGRSFSKPALGLLLTALLIFPSVYLSHYGGEKRDLPRTFVKATTEFDLPCISGDGSALVMAIHKSVRTTIIGFGDSDGRQEQISQCLYGMENIKVSYPVIILAPAIQALMTLGWLSLLGLALRNRWRMRR